MNSIPDSPKLCECGCGQPTRIADRNQPRYGIIKGQPLRFIAGHQMRTATVRSHRAYTRTPLADRFWSKVRQGDGCWTWTGGVNNRGYGTITRDGQHGYAHRVAWELEHGPIPPGLEVCHRCDNPPCVRAVCTIPGCLHTKDTPECESHLFLGTVADNAQDMVSKGRAAKSNAKLTAAQVQTIRALRASGIPATALATMFSVAAQTIRAIIRGDTW